MRSQFEVQELRYRIGLRLGQAVALPETEEGGPQGTPLTRNAQRLMLVAGTLDWVLGEMETDDFEQSVVNSLEQQIT